MKNKMQLMQAAQSAAADSLATTEPLALAKTKIETFENLVIHNEHFTEFVNFFDMARGQYQAMAMQQVKPFPVAEPPAPAAVAAPAAA